MLKIHKINGFPKVLTNENPRNLIRYIFQEELINCQQAIGIFVIARISESRSFKFQLDLRVFDVSMDS